MQKEAHDDRIHFSTVFYSLDMTLFILDQLIKKKKKSDYLINIPELETCISNSLNSLE